MNSDLESRIIDLLMQSPAVALPLREVHRVLTAEFGVRAGTLAQLCEQLRADPGPLLMVEPESPFGEAVGWPAGSRAEYEIALREAGVDFGPWVTAPTTGSEPDRESPTAVVRTSLLELWQTAGSSPGLRAAIRNALAEVRVARPLPAPAPVPAPRHGPDHGIAPNRVAGGAFNSDPLRRA